MSKPALYPTCRAITGYDDAGADVRCLKPTLDGSRYCVEHDAAIKTWPQNDGEFPDDEEFPDDDYSFVTDKLE